MVEWIHDLAAWVAHWAHTPHAMLALFCLAFAESSFFPIPPDVLLIGMCLLTPGQSFLYALICTVGSILGGAFGFILGLKGGRPLLRKLLSEEKIRLVEHYYNRWDVWAVGIAGFTPVPYKLFTISAGAFRLRFDRFIMASALGRTGRFFLVGTTLFLLGPAIEPYIKKYFNLITISFILLLILGFLCLRVFARRLR